MSSPSVSRSARLTFTAMVSFGLVAACSNQVTRQGIATEKPAEAPPGFAPAEPPPEEDVYANDPPPKWCGPKNGDPAPPLPGGTEQCPSDKNKPGCGCDTLGETAACWTGLRANRGLGICKDGQTTCMQVSENVRAWGPCEGEVLPAKTVSTGKSACRCFSEGEWKISNVVPCTIPYPGNQFAVVSTVIDKATGKPACPDIGTSTTPPPPKPAAPWSPTTLEVDCAGHYELCYEIKAGDVDAPSASDCTITKQCVTTDYLKPGVAQEVGTLPSWVSTNAACAKRWHDVGGYGEMTVKGLSVRCDAVDDGEGNPYVFSRLSYCPQKCAENPALPECAKCQNGGGGQF